MRADPKIAAFRAERYGSNTANAYRISLSADVRDLQVTARHVVARESHRRHHELEQQIGVADVVAEARDQFGDLLIDVGITRAVAGQTRHGGSVTPGQAEPAP